MGITQDLEDTLKEELVERSRLTKRRHDQPLHLLQAEVKWLRRLCWFALMAVILAIGGLLHFARPRGELYVIEKDKTGNVVYGGIVKPVDMNQQTWHIFKSEQFKKVIESWRTVTPDREAQAADWDRTFSFIGDNSPANKDMGLWFDDHNPFARSSNGESVQVVWRNDEEDGSHTWRVWFDEISHAQTNNTITRQGWRATFVYSIGTLKNEHARIENPMGILITHFDVVPDNH